MIKIFVDTDILIDYSKGCGRLLEKLLREQKEGKIELCLNPVVIAEFFTDRNLKNKDKFAQACDFFNFFSVIEVNKKIGLLAGELLRENKTSFLGDALIAATCLSANLKLATGNQKHFAKIKNLEFYPD